MGEKDWVGLGNDCRSDFKTNLIFGMGPLANSACAGSNVLYLCKVRPHLTSSVRLTSSLHCPLCQVRGASGQDAHRLPTLRHGAAGLPAAGQRVPAQGIPQCTWPTGAAHSPAVHPGALGHTEAAAATAGPTGELWSLIQAFKTSLLRNKEGGKRIPVHY